MTAMSKALYYPHTEVVSPVILKNALLLWDEIETIVPHREWKPSRPSDRLTNRALDLVVRHRVPTDTERRQADAVLAGMANDGQLTKLVQATSRGPLRRDYLIYPEKFLDQTWHMLERGGMAQRVEAQSDFGVPAVIGLLMMATLADACAGTQIHKVTDRSQAYEWLGEQHARALGSQYVTGFDVSQVAPGHDRLVALSLEVLDARSIPLRRLVELREHEVRRPGSGYGAMRRRYAARLQSHLTQVGKEARSASDIAELERQFKQEMRGDLADLKADLGLANLKTLFSKEVALSALILAGSLAAPIEGLTALGSQIGSVGIVPLLKAAVDIRGARREVLKRHTMSWLYLGEQGRLALR